jgi:alpha-D-ribose 1-methylphosphonate 5-triphosphate diphosphatase PhnM
VPVCSRAGEETVTSEQEFAEIRAMLKTLAVTVVAHDDQIEKLITLAEKHEAAIANLERQWQAYIS